MSKQMTIEEHRRWGIHSQQGKLAQIQTLLEQGGASANSFQTWSKSVKTVAEGRS